MRWANEVGEFVVGYGGGAEPRQQRRPLLNPSPDLAPVIVETFDHRLGLQEGVSRHGQRPEGVDPHPDREPRPVFGRLRSQRNLEEALQKSLVVDP